MNSHLEPHPVCKFIEEKYTSIKIGEIICIFIPMHYVCDDVLMKLVAQYFSSKDEESREFWVNSSNFIEEYLVGGRKDRKGRMYYNIVAFIVPLLMVVLIKCAFICCFMV